MSAKAARDRAQASLKGLRFYEGEICAKCGNYKRFVKSNRCHNCQKAKNKVQEMATRELLKNEFPEILKNHKKNPQFSCQKWG